jgi:hypothetical protein
VIPATLDNVTQGELQRYENNYKALNLITTTLGRNVYDRVTHLETSHEVWLKLCNTYEGSSEIGWSPLQILIPGVSSLIAIRVRNNLALWSGKSFSRWWWHWLDILLHGMKNRSNR